MNRPTLFEQFVVPMLAFTAGCFLDTTPLVPEGPDAATGPILVNPGAATSSQMEMSPPEATSVGTGHDAAVPAEDAAAPADAKPPVVDPKPAASAGTTNPGSVQPGASNTMADAGITPPPAASMQCNAVGSYGLHATFDVAWDATAWSDTGRGTVELYGLMQVDAVDPKTGAASAKFRACGLSLPLLTSSSVCSSYQLHLPDAMWRDAKLPDQKLEGQYDCTAASCALRFEPVSYSLGIRLPDAHGPWPDVEDTSPAQFVDDDADDFAGVSVDVISLASMAPGQSACGGPTPAGPGTGPGRAPAAPAGMQIGQLLVGLRTQLTAAMQVAPDCKLSKIEASDATIGLRSAGCFVAEGTDPTTASSGCSEELRAEFDRTLPSYEVVEKGKIRGMMRDMQPGAGTQLKVVRLEAGAQPGCAEVVTAKF